MCGPREIDHEDCHEHASRSGQLTARQQVKKENASIMTVAASEHTSVTDAETLSTASRY